ncbi:MAG: CPBP family glutamic-type intramembrane protease [Sphingomonas fennica]
MTATQRQAGVTFVAAAVAAVAVVLLFRLGVAYLPAPAGTTGTALLDAGVTLALFGTLAAIALLAIRREGRRGALIGPHPGRATAAGGAIGLCGLLAAYALVAIAGLGTRGSGQGAPLLLAVGTIAILAQSAAEEVYFRCWLQRSLLGAWGGAGAIAASAALFAALHLLGGTRAPLALANLFLGGLLFGLLAARSGGLAAPIAAHAAWNWAEQLLLGLDPNPGVGSFGAILDRDLAGSALWGGSAEGLNASLAASFVLVALLIPIAAWPGGMALRRRPA